MTLPRKPRLVFHIGHHKTGSTSIQDAFATGEVKIPGRRILYPSMLNHNYLRIHFDALINEQKARKDQPGQPGFAGLAKLLAAGGIDDMVLSGEEFESTRPGQLHKILKQYLLSYVDTYSIICYIRPHAGRLLSNYAEAMKTGRFDGSLEQYRERVARDNRLRYAQRVPRWAEHFGDAFHARIMAPGELYRDSVLEDFVRVAFGADAENAVITKGKASNESLGLEDLALLRLFHRQLASREIPIRHVFGWEIARLLGNESAPGPRTKLMMHRAVAEKVLRDYRDDARQMDRLYCPRRPVFLPALERAVETAPRDEQSSRPEDHFSPAMLRELAVMGRIADEMIDNHKGRWLAFFSRGGARSEAAQAPGGGQLASHLAAATADRDPALSQALCDHALALAASPDVSPAPSDDRGAPRAYSVLARLLDAMLDNHKGQWRKFLFDRRVRALHGGAPDLSEITPPVLPGGLFMNPAPAAAVPFELGATIGPRAIDRLLESGQDDPAQLWALSRKLNNVFLRGKPVPLTLDQLGRRLPLASPGLRAVLAEFMVQLFFHHKAQELTGPLRQLGLAQLEAQHNPIGRCLRLINAEGGVAEALINGGIHYIRGEIPAAYDRFDSGRRALLAGQSTSHHNRGLMSMRPMATFADWASSGAGPALPPLEFVSDARFARELPIVVIGLDGGYFARYAKRLIDSAAGAVNLHFHIVNPGSAPLTEAPNLRYSTEQAPGANIAYYASARFLRLPRLLAHYDRPLMTADADAYFTGRPDALFKRLGQTDIMMTAASGLDNKRGYLAAMPWRHVLAGIFAAAPTAGAERFLAVFGRLYAGLAAEGRMPEWWVDQALLSATADLLRRQAEPVGIEQDWLFRYSAMRQDKIDALSAQAQSAAG